MTDQGAHPYEDLGAWLTDDLFPGWARYWNDTDAVPPTFETPKPPWFRNTRVLAGVIAAVGGMLLAKGVFRAHGADLNVYLARSAALELATGAALAIALSL